MKGSAALLSCFLLARSTAALGGTFLGTVDCSLEMGCRDMRPVSGSPEEIIDPRGVTYPLTFVPAGVTSPNLKVCIQEGFDGNLSKAVEWAVGKWNALVPAVNNCVNCTTQEVGVTQFGPFNLSSVVLHELGHCAMGLGHTTLIIDTADDPNTCSNPPPPPALCREFASFTVSYGGTSNFNGLLAGPDQVKGSKDDTQLAQGGGRATNVHWFRRSDNNPVVVDVVPIDAATYSPALNELPLDSSYTANSNVGVGALLGNSQTTTVMARFQNTTSVYFDLSADDVNTVLMSRTGLNRQIGPAGGGNDDHSIQMTVVSCEVAHDIEVRAGTLEDDVLGDCDVDVDYLLPEEPHTNVVDYKLVGAGVITLNSTGPSIWSFEIPIFHGGFESGALDVGWEMGE